MAWISPNLDGGAGTNTGERVLTREGRDDVERDRRRARENRPAAFAKIALRPSQNKVFAQPFALLTGR